MGVVVVFCTKIHLRGHACLHTTKHVRCVHMPACKHIHAVANTIPVLYIHIHTYVCMYIHMYTENGSSYRNKDIMLVLTFQKIMEGCTYIHAMDC